MSALRQIPLSSLTVGGFLGAVAGALGTKAAALAVLLGGMSIMLRYPSAPYLVLVAILPVQVSLPGGLSVMRVVMVASILVIALNTLCRRMEPPRLFVGPDGVFIVIFSGSMIVATLANGVPPGSVGALGHYFIFAVLFLVTANFVRRPSDVRNTLVVIVACGLVQAPFVVAEAKFGMAPVGAVIPTELDLGENLIRVSGLSAHPITLAMFLQTAIASAIGLAILDQRAWVRTFLLATTGVLFACWFLAFSRSSAIGLMAMLWLTVATTSRPGRIAAIGSAVVAFYLFASFEFSLTKLTQNVEQLLGLDIAIDVAGILSGSESLRWRIENWAMAWNMFAERPLLGFGPEQAAAIGHNFLPPNAFAHERIAPAVAHNMFLHVAAEAGVLAVLSLMALWGIAISSLWTAASNSTTRPYAILIGIILAGQFAMGQFNPLGREMFVALALAGALGRIATAAQARLTTKSTPRLRAAMLPR